MGMGIASGQERTVEAAKRAVSNPLLEEGSIEGAKGVLINVAGGSDMALLEVTEATTIIKNMADEKANVIFGCVIDEAMADQVTVTVIATGFDRKGMRDEMASSAAGREVMTPEEKVLDRPTFMRNAGKVDFRNETMGIEGDEWDVPTFLRKKEE
jgi:cell division protein FtsZ